MPTVGEVLRRHGPRYLQQHRASLSAIQRQALAAMTACGTGALGTVVYLCAQCGRRHRVGRGCGNRHCPSCQRQKGAQWCARQLKRLLPGHYFLLTFTVPEAFRRFARQYPRQAYEGMFRASAGAIKTLAADPRRLGVCETNFFGVLHTWGRDLNYHPHIHYVVAGGGLDASGVWRATPTNFFLPCEPLSQLYRGKLKAELDQAGLLHQTETTLWKQSWVVDCQAVGDGAGAVKYLAPYVFRTAISNRNLLECNADSVTFRYRKSGSRRPRTMRLAPEEFIRRLLQHVLPRGMHKVRHYGLASPNSRRALNELQWLVSAALGLLYWLNWSIEARATAPVARCPACGGALFAMAWLPPTPAEPIADDLLPRSRSP